METGNKMGKIRVWKIKEGINKETVNKNEFENWGNM